MTQEGFFVTMDPPTATLRKDIDTFDTVWVFPVGTYMALGGPKFVQVEDEIVQVYGMQPGPDLSTLGRSYSELAVAANASQTRLQLKDDFWVAVGESVHLGPTRSTATESVTVAGFGFADGYHYIDVTRAGSPVSHAVDTKVWLGDHERWMVNRGRGGSENRAHGGASTIERLYVKSDFISSYLTGMDPVHIEVMLTDGGTAEFGVGSVEAEFSRWSGLATGHFGNPAYGAVRHSLSFTAAAGERLFLTSDAAYNAPDSYAAGYFNLFISKAADATGVPIAVPSRPYWYGEGTLSTLKTSVPVIYQTAFNTGNSDSNTSNFSLHASGTSVVIADAGHYTVQFMVTRQG